MTIESARIARGLTQEDLAKAAGISRAAYTNIENGKRRPSVKVAKKLGAILEIPWWKIIDETDAMRQTA